MLLERRSRPRGEIGGGLEGREGEGCTHVMHGRRRITIDPRISTLPGQSTPGFDRPGIRWLHQGGGGGVRQRRRLYVCSNSVGVV